MDNWIEINHDGYARQEIVRQSLGAGRFQTCDWCGSKNGHGGLFAYGIRADDSLSGRVDEIRGEFCSIGCMRTYHS